jgi:hypothetical protein
MRQKHHPARLKNASNLFYRACLTLSAAMLNIDEMELVSQCVEDMARYLPLFLNVFNAEPASSGIRREQRQGFLF